MLLQPATHELPRQGRKWWLLPQPVPYSLKTIRNNARKIVHTHTSLPSLKQGKTVMDNPSKVDRLHYITHHSVPHFAPQIKRSRNGGGSTSCSLFLPPEAMSPRGDVHDIDMPIMPTWIQAPQPLHSNCDKINSVLAKTMRRPQHGCTWII